MKKIIFVSFLFFLTHLGYGQIIELAKLSTGKLVKSSTLYDYEKDDIYGYLYIFKKDKIDSHVDSFEYVLLDKNLNKITSDTFQETKSNACEISFFKASYMNGSILIPINDVNYYLEKRIKLRYRIINTKTHELSESFLINLDGSKGIFSSANRYYYNSLRSIQPLGYIQPYNTMYYTENITKPKDTLNAEAHPKKILFLNNNLEYMWTYKYNENATTDNYENITIPEFESNPYYIILRKIPDGKINQKKQRKGEKLISPYLFLDSKNGQLVNSINIDKDSLGITETSTEKIFFQKKDTVVFIKSIQNENSANAESGFVKAEYSISSGKELKRNYFFWDQLSDYLHISKNGYITDKEIDNSEIYDGLLPNGYYPYLHNILVKSNGNLIFILEQYRSTYNGAKISDLFFFELDKTMKLVEFKAIKKDITKVKIGAPLSGEQVESIGGFDYSGYQNLGNDNYRFFYYNQQKPENGKKKEWIMGIISYIDGKFSEQKLPLKSEDGSGLFITPAKKEYLMIYETFKKKDKSLEIRLEKIN